MARIVIPPYVNCPHCGAQNPAAEPRCGSCGQSLTLYIGPVEHFPRRLDLGSLMLLIALVAVCLGITREVPVLGVFLLAVVLPALLRTFVWMRRAEGDGQALIWPEKFGAFAASTGVVWLIVLGTGVAFLVGLALGTAGGAAFLQAAFGRQNSAAVARFIGVPLGCAGAALIGYWLVKGLWPIKD